MFVSANKVYPGSIEVIETICSNDMVEKFLYLGQLYLKYKAARPACRTFLLTQLPLGRRSSLPRPFQTPDLITSEATPTQCIPMLKSLNILKFHILLTLFILIFWCRFLDSYFLCRSVVWCIKSCYRTSTTWAGTVAATFLQHAR